MRGGATPITGPRRAFAAAFALVVAFACVPAAVAAVAPYGAADAGGFRNVLPAGQAGTANALQFAQYQAMGVRPPHWTDQLGMYTDLLYASPSLTHDQIPRYFKDATFGVREDDVASTISPRPGVRIVRDRSYGVPHVYGDTREDVMFGAGYAGAQDRLFLMDILRHTGRAQLSSFAGGSAGNREMDRTQWAIAPYTEADLQAQIENAPKLYGDAGRMVVSDGREYVAGVNAYIDDAMLQPLLMPAEYAAFGTLPRHFTLTDVIATASLIGGIFGKGGGGELSSALTLRALEQRFGTRRGRRAWHDFRSKNDPEAPTTARGKFPYETTSAFARRGLALPDPGSVKFTPVGPPLSPASSRSQMDIGAQLRRALSGRPHASNWELISARESATGHPIAVMGPQVGYYVPQILMEEDLHGPGIDARGAAFPGVNQYVQLGHGRDYAWSATTATSDNVDTFAEILCQDDFHYVYRGECRAMERLERTNSWQPSAGDSTPAGSETLTAYRTVHGIVYARGTVGGRKTAFVHARSTYFHEADSALGFIQLNDPGFTRDARSFQRAVSNINFAFNWAYVDSESIAYYLSGWYPRRARGTSPDFPILGTGEYDWEDFDPDLQTSRVLAFKSHPRAIDPPYLISWNNKQAPRWAAADDQWGYGPLYRSQLIESFVRRAIKGRRKMTLEQLVTAMEEPATQDIRAVRLLPTLLRAVGRPADERTRQAVELLRAWGASGGHRRDLNKDGRYDDDAAVTLMDAWWPRLVKAAFQPALGEKAYDAVRGMLAIGDPIGGGASAPAFSDGWWGYISKDLRALFGKRPRGAYSRRYCGGGRRGACRAALQASLREALDVPRADLYGKSSECGAAQAHALCHDMNRWTVASAIPVDPFPLQNRPTFQQTVELKNRLPR